MESSLARQPQEFVTLTELEDTFCEVDTETLQRRARNEEKVTAADLSA
jgi:hypothetical protein